MTLPLTRTGRPNTSGGKGGVPQSRPLPAPPAGAYDPQQEAQFRGVLQQQLDDIRRVANIALTSLLQNETAFTLLGNPTAAAAAASAVSLTAALAFAGSSLDIAPGGVTFAKLATAAIAAQSDANAGTSDTVLLTPHRSKQGTLAGVRAGLIMHGGGTVSFDGTNVKWTSRLIVIGDAKGTESAYNAQYNQMTCPTSGSIDVVGTTAVTATASGIPLAAWGALYYDLSAGFDVGASGFHIILYNSGTANFAPPPAWVLICARNDDSTPAVKFSNGMVLPSGDSQVYGDPALAWSTYTPVVSSGVGTLTTVSASGRFKQIGKTVLFRFTVTITTNGTGAGSIIVSLPVGTPTVISIGHGQEVNNTGKAIVGFSSGTNMICKFYDNTYPGSDGAGIVVNGIYETT